MTLLARFRWSWLDGEKWTKYDKDISAQLDTAFGGLQRELDGIGRVRLTEPGGGAVTMWLGRGLDWIQIFTADPLPGDWHRAAVAVEPMTCPPDAFNSGTDLIRLEPGAESVHRWGIHAG